MEEKGKEIKKLEEMPMSTKMRFSEELGKKVAGFLNRATRKANKLLNQYGYEVSVVAEFKELKEDK